MSRGKKVLIWSAVIVVLGIVVLLFLGLSMSMTHEWATRSKPTQDTPTVCKTYYSEVQAGNNDPTLQGDCTEARSPAFHWIFRTILYTTVAVAIGWPVLLIILIRTINRKRGGGSIESSSSVYPKGYEPYAGQMYRMEQQRQERERLDRQQRGGY